MINRMRLMSIKQAAEYLGVSKTSLRRWTNDGRLACVRVGSRQERRFRQEDLDRFVDYQDAVSPSRAGSTLTRRETTPGHVSTYFHNADEQWAMVRPYLEACAAGGRPLVYVCDDGREELVRSMVSALAPELDPGDEDQVRIVPASQVYVRSGHFDVQATLDFMHSAILAMRARGFTDGVITGETNWYMGRGSGVENFLEYEARLNGLLEDHPSVAVICQYDLSTMDGGVVFDSLFSHPIIQSRAGLASGL